jgi:hypothetical protein
MGHNPRGGLLKLLLLVRIEQDVRKAIGLGAKATTDERRESKMKALILQSVYLLAYIKKPIVETDAVSTRENDQRYP